jgi:hypothetical protein
MDLKTAVAVADAALADSSPRLAVVKALRAAFAAGKARGLRDANISVGSDVLIGDNAGHYWRGKTGIVTALTSSHADVRIGDKSQAFHRSHLSKLEA